MEKPKHFLHLSFKKNEDVNPTKSSQRGMNPEHLALAKQELSTPFRKASLSVQPLHGHVKLFMSTSMLSKSKENLDW